MANLQCARDFLDAAEILFELLNDIVWNGYGTIWVHACKIYLKIILFVIFKLNTYIPRAE